MSRIKMVAGNWKMNLDYQQGLKLAKTIRASATSASDKLVVLAPPSVYLGSVAEYLADAKYIRCAAQNCHEQDYGAYTGEISAPMIKSIKADYVILGHSERREYFSEDAKLLKKKVDKVLEHDLLPIFCCGESLAVRKSGSQEDYVAHQLAQSLFHLEASDFSKITIAYEPIWAIGTGETASPQQAQDMHQSIRQLIAGKFGTNVADQTTILYGGSVKPANANELFSQPDVDGGLVGGASLKAEDFCAIISAL